MSSRLKDIPALLRDGSNLNAVMAAVQEVMQTFRGYRGDKLDKALTLRDLSLAAQRGISGGGAIDVGIIGGTTPGAPITDAYVVDPTPPPTPDGLNVSSGISSLFVSCASPVYTQGHGHAVTVVYGAKLPTEDLTQPTFSEAVELFRYQGTFSAYATDPATRWCIWIKWQSVDGVQSTDPAGGTNGVVATTGQDVALLLDALTGEITSTELHATLGTRIDLIDAASSVAGSVNARLSAETVARTNALAEEATTRAAALLAEAASRASSDSDLQTQINTITAATGGDLEAVIAAVQQEQTARASADGAEAASRETLAVQMRGAYTGTDINAVTTGLMYSERVARVSAMDAEVMNRNAAIVSNIESSEGTLTALNDALLAGLGVIDSASAVRTQAEQDARIAAVISETNARISADDAEASARLALVAVVNANAAILTQEQNTRAAADSTMAAQINTMSAAFDDNTAAIQAEAIARADADTANASSISTLSSTVTANQAAAALDATTKANAAQAAAEAYALAQANLATITANAYADGIVTDIEAAAIAAAAADATSKANAAEVAAKAYADTVSASALSAATALIQTEASTRASADTAEANARTTLQATVDGHTSSIQTEATTRATQTGELYAQYTVKVDVAGNVAGYGLASVAVNGVTKSDFGVRADKFWLAAPVGYTQSSAPTATSWGTNAIYAITKGIALLAVGAASGAIVGGSTKTWVRATHLGTVWGSVQANAICYGSGVYVVVGASGKAATSADGKTWTNQTGLASTTFGTTTANAVCHGNGMFVVIGDSGKCAKGVYDPVTGSMTWTYAASLATLWSSDAGYCLAFASGLFWAFGAGGKTASSSDGITWTTTVTGTSLPTAMSSNAVRAVTLANGLIVAVGDSGKVATSADGTSWTARASLAGTTWGTASGRAIVHNDSIFVVMGDAGKVATSVDGITWTYRDGLIATTWGTSVARGAVFNDGKVIVVGDAGKVASSSDGITWVYTSSLSKASTLGEGTVWVDTSVTPNVTKYYVDGAWVTTSPALPFAVTTSPDIIDGIPVPAGMYVDAAFIKNGTITNAKIGSAAIDDAKIANLSVAKLEAGSLKVGSYIQSADYTPGAGGVGYRIDRDAVVLPATSIRGTLTAAQINSNGLDVKDSAGNVILSAGSSLAAQMASRMGGGNMVPNSDLSGGAGNWAVTWNQGGGTNYSFGVDVGGVEWSPAGGHSVSVARTGETGAASGVFDIRPAKTIPARPNTRYELSAYLSAHRCPAGFSIMVLDSAGSYITEMYYANTAEDSGGKDLNNWSRPGGFYTTPANATQFHIGLRAGAATAADPYAWMTRMFIAEAGANQTVLSPWSAGGSSGQFGELDKLTSANVSTYIASAAIGEAYIGDLNASKITAGTIAADRLDSGTVTAKVANLSAAVITSGTIGSARIGDASIGTLKLGENSATICKSQSGTSGYVDVVFTIGYAADVLVVGSGVNSSAYNFGLQMNGSWITGVQLAQGLITMSAKVTLAAGTHTASVRCDGRSGTISIFASIR
jgi:hypothetical protein